MKVLESENLRKLQLVEVALLKKLDAVCTKYDIPYFICYGTAIGAIRHKAFIPWDDDIDVGMMRTDYEKLKQVPRSEWEEANIRLVDPGDRFDAHLWTYPRLYMDGTVFESGTHYYEVKKPDSDTKDLRIWLDIFLYDRFESIAEIESLKRKAFWLKKQYYYSVCDRIIRKGDSIKRILIELGEKAMHRYLQFYKNPKKTVWEKYQSLFHNVGEYITTFDTPYDPITIVSKYNEMFPLQKVEFEGIPVSIQKDYHEAMTRIYGDYMQLPPVEKRITHLPVVLDFGEGNVIHDTE